jgi:hypothetical protein
LGIIHQFYISDGIGSCNGEEEMFSLKYHTPKAESERRRQLGCLLMQPKELIFTIFVLSIEIEERIEEKTSHQRI